MPPSRRSGAGLVPKAFTVPLSRPKASSSPSARRPASASRRLDGSPQRLQREHSQAATATSAAAGSAPATAAREATDRDRAGRDGPAAGRGPEQLNASGLKAGIVYVASDEVQGTVVSQAPEGGTTQKRDTRIQLNVSLGPRAVVKGVRTCSTSLPRRRAPS